MKRKQIAKMKKWEADEIERDKVKEDAKKCRFRANVEQVLNELAYQCNSNHFVSKAYKGQRN